ncbi:MAG: hypothetical protein ACK56I_20340, partial [bacterium]
MRIRECGLVSGAEHHDIESIITKAPPKPLPQFKLLVDFAHSHHAKEGPAAGRLCAVGAQSSGSILCEID